MNINNVALCKVVEVQNGIALINALDKSDRPEAVELIVADAYTCGLYLARYLHARALGRSMLDSHRQALAGARCLKYWEPE